MKKERVFQIMGNYYGNAYYRFAIEKCIPEEDLVLIKEILDEVNSFGYTFSNLGALKNVEDCRFVPIILECFQKFKSANFRTSLLNSICFPSYFIYIPDLLRIYEDTSSPQLRLDISKSLLCIRSKKYISDYLRIIYKQDFGVQRDYLIDLLCMLRVKEVLPKLIELLCTNPHDWNWVFLKYAPVFRDSSVLPLIEPYLKSDDNELKALAQKAIKKLTEGF